MSQLHLHGAVADTVPWMRWVSLLACFGLLTGCFGYNSSAKKWAYAGDTILILGGGATFALAVTDNPEPCMGGGCPYISPIPGGYVAGALLAGAGLFGIIFNATRDTVKTSR
jgi:hypothetical protein